MPQVELKDVTKTFPHGARPVLDGFCLSVEDGESVAIVGPAGCGKTMALRLIAGLDQPTGGEIRIGDRVVNEAPPKDRDVALSFQNDALYPHLTVYRNIAFGLLMRKTPRPEVDRRVRQAAEMLGISNLLDRGPKALDEEQCRRVGLARLVARRAGVCLIDEPFGSQDPATREAMGIQIARLCRLLGATTILATRDAEVARALGVRVVAMEAGVASKATA
jgi:multiple sugar transport system ATP-binding protein